MADSSRRFNAGATLQAIQAVTTIGDYSVIGPFTALVGAMIAYVLLDYRRLNAHLDEATRALESARRGGKDAERR